MVTNPQATDFYTILQSIQTRLVEVTKLDPTYVRIVASDNYKYDFEVSMITIRPLGPEPSTNAGGGRQARPERRNIRVYCNIRSSLDQVGKDDVALRNLFTLENTINDALDEFYPNINGQNLTIEPLHPVDGGNQPPIREPNDDIGEIFSLLNYEVVFVRPNSIPQP